MEIVVLDGFTLNPGDNSWEPVAGLGDLKVFDQTRPEEIRERAGTARIILTNKVPLSEELIAGLPNLEFVSVLATGFNIVDIVAARKRGIAVSNVPVYGTDAVAQYVFAAILHVIHNIGAHDAAIRDGQWQKSNAFSFWLTPLRELAGKTIGIVGFGRIGRRVGEIANAFGMKVITTDRHHGERPNWPGFRRLKQEELFQESDFVSLHCPLTDSNGEFVNRELLSHMKNDAILINASRGGLVNEADLAAALDGNRLLAAVVDVVSQEPILADNPLLRAKNCFLTPHLAWAAIEARRRMMLTTAENIQAFQRGTPINVVN